MNDIDGMPGRRSAAANWAPLARFIAADERIAHWAGKRPATAFLYEFVRFGLKQGWACLFGGAMVGLLIATSLWYPRGAPLAAMTSSSSPRSPFRSPCCGFAWRRLKRPR